MNQKLIEIYNQVAENTKKGSPTYYYKLPKEDSDLIKLDYISRLKIPVIPVMGSDKLKFYTFSKNLIAIGYQRIVVGDYGAYIEFSADDIFIDKLKDKYKSNNSKKPKYIWKYTNDDSQTKVYLQVSKVPYADYQPGFYYISPIDLLNENWERLYQV